MFLNGYPYTDFHEMNLDFLLKSMETLKKDFADFTASNSLIFAEPLLFDITKSYAKNTIVLDPDGNAHISLQNVPVGVQLSDADYWLMVFNFEDYTEKANKNFTVNYFRDTTRAPYALAVGDWCVLDDVLYTVTQAIAADELLVPGTNLTHFTVEQFLKDFVTSINQTVLQYKNDIDASELAFTNNLQAQFDAAVGAMTVDSEVVLARQGYDGITYPTLANAIQGQFKETSELNSKNLAWFTDPTSDTVNGLNIKFNGDGTITIQGTTTAATYIFLRGATSIADDNLTAGTYTFSRKIIDGSGNVRIVNDGNNIISGADLYKTETQTLVSNGRIYLYIGNNITINGTFEFQIEAGSTATDFTPAFLMTSDDLVARYTTRKLYEEFSPVYDAIGYISDNVPKNLAWFTDTTNRTVNGLQLVFNDDGTLTVDGTATATTYIYLRGATSNVANLPAGTYTFSRKIIEGYGNVRMTNDGTNFISSNVPERISITQTLATDGHIYLSVGNNVTVHGTFAFQIEAGSSLTNFESAFDKTALDKASRSIGIVDTSLSCRYAQMDYTLQGADYEFAIYLNDKYKIPIAHSIDADKNCDCWRINFNRFVDDLTETPISGSSEWEFAFEYDGNFSGGWVHGNEVSGDITVYIDGVEVSDITTLVGRTNAKCEIRVVRNGTLYDALGSAMCDHGVEYVFTKDGMTINQSVKWNGAYLISTAYMAMFPPLKTVTDQYYDDTSYTPGALTSDNFAITLPECDKIFIKGDDVAFEFTSNIYPDLTGGDEALITDNGGNSYNKCYFTTCKNYTTTTNEIWKSSVSYKYI